MFEAKQKANWSLCDGLSWLRCMVCFFSVDCPKIKTYWKFFLNLFCIMLHSLNQTQ